SIITSFFFQAEDGIRAFHVTGVQTCALPISQLPVVVGFVSIPPQGGHDHQDLDQLSTSLVSGGTSVSDSAGTVLTSSSNSSSFRSEERRVGKECRSSEAR